MSNKHFLPYLRHFQNYNILQFVSARFVERASINVAGYVLKSQLIYIAIGNVVNNHTFKMANYQAFMTSLNHLSLNYLWGTVLSICVNFCALMEIYQGRSTPTEERPNPGHHTYTDRLPTQNRPSPTGRFKCFRCCMLILRFFNWRLTCQIHQQ